MIINNEQVQAVLDDAVYHLETLANWHKAPENSKWLYLMGLLSMYKAYSASGNEIAGLGGLGIEEIIDLAERVNQGEFDSRLDVKFANSLIPTINEVK